LSGGDPGIRVLLVTASGEACAERLARARVDEKLAARVKELHPYDLPEVLELPAVGGSDAYLDWIRLESS
jgi:uncharacterized protein involved in tolerance to divalent cations